MGMAGALSPGFFGVGVGRILESIAQSICLGCRSRGFMGTTAFLLCSLKVKDLKQKRKCWKKPVNCSTQSWQLELCGSDKFQWGRRELSSGCTMAAAVLWVSVQSPAFWKVWPQNLVTEDKAVLKEEQKPRCTLTWEAAPFSWKKQVISSPAIVIAFWLGPS